MPPRHLLLPLQARRRLLGLLAAAPALSAPWSHAAPAARRLRIGVTLHPYYSFVANIVGPHADVTPVIPAGFNPHAYEPRAEDIKRLNALDVVVLNGVGHDDFAERMIAASDNRRVTLIEANTQVPLLAAVGAGRKLSGKVVNPHTFLSITASVSQIHTIARELGRIEPALAQTFMDNARRYTQRLRQLRADALASIAQAPAAHLRIATIHGAYDYLLREFGLEVAAVVEPAHGIEPSPAQLRGTIDEIRRLNVKVIFSEMDFPSAYVDTIRRETGARLYALTHISHGPYTPEKFEQDMGRNLATVVQAIRESGT